MKILFYLGHPAHYHLFKNIIKKLQRNNHETIIVIKKKDILEDLLDNDGLKYINILPEGRKDKKLLILLGLLKRDLRLAKIVTKRNIDVMVGSEPALAQVGRLFAIPSITMVEDDTKVIPYFAYSTYPFTNCILAPVTCNIGKWSKKKISYNGYQKLSYLHPNHFNPNLKKIVKFIEKDERYFILRLSKLKAYHDFGYKGLNPEIVRHLLDMLLKYGKVYISSERELEPEFERYGLNLKPNDIHHALYYAEMYIGDSQSMAMEAAILGVPSIRFSDFAGKISVLEELEYRYKLTYGIRTYEPDKLYAKIKELLALPHLKKEWQKRRQKMLSDKIDVTAFFVWFVENYPDSAEVMKENPDYQLQFK